MRTSSMKKSNKKIQRYKKIAAYSLILALLIGITGCGTSLNGAVAKGDGSGRTAAGATERMLKGETTEQVATDEYLNMTGATEADYSKYENSATGKQTQSSVATGNNTGEVQGSGKTADSGNTADTSSDFTTGNSTGATTGNAASNTSEDTSGGKASTDANADTKSEHTCTLTVTCATILNHMEDLAAGKESLIPSDGIIYSNQEVTFTEGETVFDVLKREMKDNRIQMEYTSVPAYGSDYIEAINNLYEFDCGQNSGWKYSVNGTYPTYGCSQYELKDQDVIQWAYTCELGKDLE